MRYEFTVGRSCRVKTFLKEHDVSKGLLAKIKFEGGHIWVNGEEQFATYPVHEGDVVAIEIPDEAPHETLKPIPFDLDIVLDGNKTIKEKAILYAILNGKSVGGFENVIDEASMNDGFMDILIVKNIDNPLDIPKILIDLMNSNLTNNDYIRTLQAKKCEIKKVVDKFKKILYNLIRKFTF